MMSKYISLCLLVLLLVGCDETIDPSIPKCLVEELKKDTHNVIEVWKWTNTQGTYYYTLSACCDFYNNLYDANCELICAPDGGITGEGSGDCPELAEPIEKILLWSKNAD